MSNKFSVLISVYARENPDFFRSCLDSVVHQSLMPSEIVVVEDGPLGDALRKTLQDFQSKYGGLFVLVPLATNHGLGLALQKGLEKTANDLICRMDSDDIADERRFEKQVAFLLENPDHDVVGSSTLEFIRDPGIPSQSRVVPETHEEIRRAAQRRNPMNHMTVAFRKSKVLAAGGYQHVPYFEDYDLWVRMLLRGSKFYNLREPLVRARVGNDMIGKRHGIAYCRHEIYFFARIRRLGFISNGTLYVNLLLRLPMRLMPKAILTILYKLALRRKKI